MTSRRAADRCPPSLYNDGRPVDQPGVTRIGWDAPRYIDRELRVMAQVRTPGWTGKRAVFAGRPR